MIPKSGDRLVRQTRKSLRGKVGFERGFFPLEPLPSAEGRGFFVAP